MRNLHHYLAAALVALPLAGAACAADVPETPMTFKAADGVVVHAVTWAHAGKARGTVLLFHQAGSNSGEYAGIGPRLAAEGFNAIAVDQRAGGSMFGRENLTVKALGAATDYLAALPDFEAALAKARSADPGGRVILWGSSYSASLVFLLAGEHPEAVRAVLAFSPGEYFKGHKVTDWATKVGVPVYVTSASDPDEIVAAKIIAAAVPGAQAQVYVPKTGVHGASTLREDADAQGMAENWGAVDAFLDRVAPAQ
jgi:pimeloyl-ACP methyl ester carboxylesterase